MHQTMTHRTFETSRTFVAEPAKVFAAFRDPRAREVWGAPWDGLTLEIKNDDFREGGEDITVCLTDGTVSFQVVTHFIDIVEDRRILFTETVEADDKRMGTSLLSVELQRPESGTGTHLVLTCQTAALDDGGLDEGVADGWGAALDSLVRHVDGAASGTAAPTTGQPLANASA